jgi:uncharacterized protein YecT (DUF1311 family)
LTHRRQPDSFAPIAPKPAGGAIMIVHRLAAIATVAAGLAATPVPAASFDCGKAETPFEHAICDMPELSAADEILAKAFATATGGLTKESVVLMRADQRNWLDYAQTACNDGVGPLTSGSYDEAGGSCLLEKFQARSRALEQSRMLGGHRFFLKSVYGALPDPMEADNADSYWKVANHELALPQLDGDDALAEGFNAFVTEQGADLSSLMEVAGGGEVTDLDPSSDTSVTVAVNEVAGSSRITLEANTYWYGHGAAHGNWGISYLHYLVAEERALVASDVFAGDGWEATLRDAAWAQLQAEHAEWLQVEKAEDIAAVVIDPSRWNFEDSYGLVIQFEPYEVSAYAYGAPTITIPWEQLDAIKAEGQDGVRYGY